MAEVSMDYGVVENMAQGFRSAADALHSVDQALEAAAALLRASAFVGMVGNLALAAYLENIRPHVARLSATCEELDSDLLGAIASLRDGDHSGSQRFVGGANGGGIGGGSSNPAAGAPGITSTSAGQSVNVANYADGQNGWELVNMSGDFTPGELVSQGTKPACTLYSTMNLLIENGYNISQADADRIYQQHLDDLNIFSDTGVMMDVLKDGSHDTAGFGLHHAEDILDQYDADYDHDDFKTWMGLGDPDRGDAEQFLVRQVKSGNPVLVTSQVDDSFGLGKGGHAYTVLGVQTDNNGKLTNVLVSSNWGGSQTWELPADRFMDDWMNWNGGEYIVVEKD